VATAAVVEAQPPELAIHHGSAGVRHAHDVAPQAEVVATVAGEVDVETVDLDRDVVGEGVLDAAANRPAPAPVVALFKEEAAAGGPNEAAREPGGRVEIED